MHNSKFVYSFTWYCLFILSGAHLYFEWTLFSQGSCCWLLDSPQIPGWRVTAQTWASGRWATASNKTHRLLGGDGMDFCFRMSCLKQESFNERQNKRIFSIAVNLRFLSHEWIRRPITCTGCISHSFNFLAKKQNSRRHMRSQKMFFRIGRPASRVGENVCCCGRELTCPCNLMNCRAVWQWATEKRAQIWQETTAQVWLFHLCILSVQRTRKSQSCQK